MTNHSTARLRGNKWELVLRYVHEHYTLYDHRWEKGETVIKDDQSQVHSQNLIITVPLADLENERNPVFEELTINVPDGERWAVTQQKVDEAIFNLIQPSDEEGEGTRADNNSESADGQS